MTSLSTTRRLATIFATLVLATTPVLAAPKGKKAKAQFDKGVAAYTKGDYAGAAAALGKSYALEADAETLFAWAQTERKLDNCTKALDLYSKLLAMALPEENKDAVRVQIEECNAILSVDKPAKTEPKVEPKIEPRVEPKTEPKVEPKTEPKTAPATDTTTDTKVEPTTDGDGRLESNAASTTSPASTGEGARAWWKDPVGGSLVGLGVVGVGVGIVFLVQGSSAQTDADNAMTYADHEAASDRAESRGRIGVISLIAGGALITGGVIWYATHKQKPADNTVSGWLAPSGGGLALSGRF